MIDVDNIARGLSVWEEALMEAFAHDNLALPENTTAAADARLSEASIDPLTAKPVWDVDQDGQPPSICPLVQSGGSSAVGKNLIYDGGKCADGTPTRSGLDWHFTAVEYWRSIVEWTNEADSGLSITVNELRLVCLRKFMSCYQGTTWVRGSFQTLLVLSRGHRSS
jgi:hypothetical protein